MLRSRTFGHVMARLALLAMLLMALAPTISRTLASGSDSGGQVMRALQMCTTSGLQTKLVSVLFDGSSSESARNGGATPHPHDPGDACGYCSLLAPLPLLLLFFIGIFALPTVAPANNHYAFVTRIWRNVRGLGSQAPPFVL